MARETVDIRELVGTSSAFIKAEDYTLLITWDTANNRGTGKPLRLSMSELGATLVALGVVGAPGSGGGGGGASPVEVVEYQESPNITLNPDSGVGVPISAAAPSGFFGLPVIMSYRYETDPPDFPDLSVQIQFANGVYLEFTNNSSTETVVLTSYAVRYLQEVV